MDRAAAGAGRCAVHDDEGTEKGTVCLARDWRFPRRREPGHAAGDIFHGAFAYGLLNNFPLEKCVAYANIAAGLSIDKIGARNSMPTLNEVISVYNDKNKNATTDSQAQAPAESKAPAPSVETAKTAATETTAPAPNNTNTANPNPPVETAKPTVEPESQQVETAQPEKSLEAPKEEQPKEEVPSTNAPTMAIPDELPSAK